MADPNNEIDKTVGELTIALKALPENVKNFAVIMGDAEDAFDILNKVVNNLPKHINVIIGEFHEVRQHIENDVIDFDENLYTLAEALVRRILGDMTIVDTFTFEQWSEMKEYMFEKDKIFQNDISALVEGSTKLIENQKKHRDILLGICDRLEIGGNAVRQAWSRFLNNFRSRESVAQQEQIEDLLYGDSSAPKQLIDVTMALVNMLKSFQAYFALIRHSLDNIVDDKKEDAIIPEHNKLYFDILQGHTKTIMEYCNLYLMSIPDTSAQLYAISFMQKRRKNTQL